MDRAMQTHTQMAGNYQLPGHPVGVPRMAELVVSGVKVDAFGSDL